MRLFVALLCLRVATAYAADEPLSAYEDMHRTDVALQRALIGGGAASVAAGASMCAFDRYDHALQVAGGLTLAFGAANVLAGIAGEVVLRREARHIRAQTVPDALRIELQDLAEKKTVTYAVNLGLDLGYVIGGLVAITASQAGIDNHERWLGAGVAIVIQGTFAAVIDFAGTFTARRAARRLR